jgi:hypothetical protein
MALRLLGHALLGVSERTAAAVAYEQVAHLDELLGFHHLRAETATDLARVALAEGDTAFEGRYRCGMKWTGCPWPALA